MAVAHSVAHVGCVAPRGGRVDVPGRLAVLPRRVLDHLLQHAAAQAGARFEAPWRFEAPLEQGARVVGATLGQGGLRHTVRARWVVLATGARGLVFTLPVLGKSPYAITAEAASAA